MKLKKLLAAVTAAALAITTMVVTSFTASAEGAIVNDNVIDIGTDIATLGTSLGDVDWSGGLKIENLSTYATYADNSYLKIDFTVPESGGQFYVTDCSDWNSSAIWQSKSGYIYATFTGAMASNGVMLNGENATITSVKLVNGTQFTKIDTLGTSLGDVDWSGGLKFENLSAYATYADKSYLKVDFTVPESGGQFYVTDCSDWNSSAIWQSKSGSIVVDFTSAMASNGIMINGENVAITNVEIYAVPIVETPTLTLSPTTASVAVDATTEITMIATNADGYTFTAASSDTTKATVTETATGDKFTVTGVAAGDATITVTGTNGSDTITATCNVTVTAAGDSGGDEGDDTPTTTTLWTGNTDMGTDWSANVHIPAEKFANIKAGDTLKFTFTKGSADYFQLKFASASQGWPVLSSPVKNEYNSVDLTDSPYSFVVNAADAAALKADGMGINGYGVILTKVELISAGGSEDPKPPVVDPPVNPPVDPDTPSTPDTPVTPPVVSGNSVTMGSTEFNGWFEAVLTKDQLFGSNTGATTITFTGADLSKVGYNSVSAGGYKGIDCTGTVTIQINDIDLSDNFFLHVGGNAATVVTWSFNGGSSGGNEPSNPTDPSNPSAPSYGSTYEPPIPSGATSISMVDTIISTGAASLSFNLGSSAKLDKEVFEALASKGDITVRFNVAGGAYWEIGGANITAAKAVDLGVRMNSTLIPASAVSELAGDKTTIQLSLKHNGDFGFTGVLNVPVGKANSGKFANLYYYHSGKFDFVGSSAISNGRAKFAFSHASNYLIVIDDYAYGEDVSSAAGMTETTETSAVPYVAALVVVSAFAASAVVLKKRLSK